MEKVRQLVQLKQVMSRWRGLSLWRNQHASVACEEEGGSSLARPVPPGFMGIYIGEERRRFIIPARFLNFPAIASMLYKYEEELGYTESGGLVLPCSVDFFRMVLRLLDKDEDKYKAFTVDMFQELTGAEGIHDLDASCGDDVAADDRHGGYSPLLQKAMI